MTPAQAAAALADLPIVDTLASALATQTQLLAETICASLTNSPGGPHERPWRQTGALEASIAVSADALSARIGSNSPAAAPQELGTIHGPPRPFLAPAAAAAAEPAARAIGRAVAGLLARRLT